MVCYVGINNIEHLTFNITFNTTYNNNIYNTISDTHRNIIDNVSILLMRDIHNNIHKNE